MTSPRQIDTAIFDLGGVLMLNGSPRDLVKRFPDQDPEVMIELVMGPLDRDSDHQWHRLERGELAMKRGQSHHRCSPERARHRGCGRSPVDRHRLGNIERRAVRVPTE